MPQTDSSNDIETLRRFFNIKHPKYFFVIIDDERLLNFLLEEVIDTLERKVKTIHHLILNEDDFSVFRQVKNYTDPKIGLDGLIISGLNELYVKYGDACLDALNKSRDAFDTIGLPIIWNINSNTLKKILRVAFDFYHLRHLPDFHIQVQGPTPAKPERFDINFFYNPYPGDKELDTDYLETELKGVPKNQRHEKETINSMVIPLLRIYLERNDLNRMKKLYKTFLKGYEERVHDSYVLVSYYITTGNLAKSPLFPEILRQPEMVPGEAFSSKHSTVQELIAAIHEKKGAVALVGPHSREKEAIIAHTLNQLKPEGFDYLIIYGETSPELILLNVALKSRESGDTKALDVFSGEGTLEDKLDYYVSQLFSHRQIGCLFYYFEENQADMPGGGCKSQRLQTFLQRFCHSLKNKESFLFFSTSFPSSAFFTVTMLEGTAGVSLGSVINRLSQDERTILEVLSIFHYPVESDGLLFFDIYPAKQEPFTRLKNEELIDIIHCKNLEVQDVTLYFVPLEVCRFVRNQMAEEKKVEYHLLAGRYFEQYRRNRESSYIMNVFQARWHFVAAGDWDMAAEATLKLFWPVYSLNFINWALELLNALKIENLSPNLQYEVQRRLGILYYYTGSYSYSWSHYEKALQLVDTKEQQQQLSSEILPVELAVKPDIYTPADRVFKGVFHNLNVPVEIIKQGPPTILEYLKELSKNSVPLLECKLIIVGNGEVGKTTLMKKLLDPAFQVTPGSEETTHGIHIEPWQLDVPFSEPDATLATETVHLNFWDFGGQDIYHATHQFFLTKRSLYLFVWEVRREDETRSFDYWLNILKLLSAESPVIIIMNKADLRTKYIEEASFKTKFPNIQSYHQISCLTGQGITQLTGAIRDNLSAMPHLRDKLPAVWMKIRARLDKEKINKNFISRKDYFSLCAKFDLNEERADFLSYYLHDLGIILHYRHDPLLEDTVILKPEWATEALYKLIDTRAIQENKGSFRFQQLKEFWDCQKYPVEKHLHLMHLMETFELCFNFSGTDEYFVPELLQPFNDTGIIDPFKESGILRFQYHYDFLPDGIVNRFMARLYYLIHEKKFWKNGVILSFDDAQALVQAEPLNRRVTIAIKGENQLNLLSIIRSHFRQIHETLNMEANQHYNEMIPCLCSQCQNAADPYVFKYEKMLLYKSKGIETTTCNDSYETVSIAALLMGFAKPERKHNLRDSLIIALSHLQGIAKTIKDDEGSRNGFISLLLSKDGFRVKDQTRWGSSATGKKISEVAIKIESEEGRTVSVIETFNLEYLDLHLIAKHFEIIFSYDATRINELYIIVFSDATDFSGIWKKYLNALTGMDFHYPLIGYPIEEETGFSEIKAAHTRHDQHGKEIVIHHLFVNMNRGRLS